jgi:dienelactone hydrolase
MANSLRIATLTFGAFDGSHFPHGDLTMLRIGLSVVALALCQSMAMAAVQTETITYKVGEKTFKGFLAFDDAVKGKRPGILVVHEAWGLDAYARKRAEMLAGLGYVAFAVDMYGDGKSSKHPEEAGAMMKEARANQKEWLARASAGLDILRKNPHVDATKLASIGYCFGGSTSLALANAGTDIKAAVSFHGSVLVPSDEEVKGIKARILICHGAADTFIPEKTIQEMRAKYDNAKVDYQMIYYGGAVHSFTVPGVEEHGMKGVAYDANADHRSWAAMRALFDEVFK